MPVSTGSFGEPRAKRCKFCDESNHRSESGCGYWQLQLDRDLIDTISAIYPEWFRHNMAEGGGGLSHHAARETSPKAVVDTSPIRIDQNKESLKVKLMLRRPLDQLVDQGIMPPHKTPAAYHGQRRQLERAKTGDMLKAKIQQRPSRQELERRHILESDPGHLDPSLVERQRMLKKARLADQLNDQLSHRPGPLELIRKNILHTEEPIETAVKTGRISYKATSEGQLNRPQHPSSYVTPEEDSQSSEGDLVVSPGPSDVLENAAKSAGIVVSLLPAETGTVVVSSNVNNVSPVPVNKEKDSIVFTDFRNSVPLISRASPAVSITSSASSTLSPLSSVASPGGVISQPGTPIPPPLPSMVCTPKSLPSPVAKSDAPGKDKNRKKSKSKSIPKTRTIKFHEYKGPPSAQKNNSSNNYSGESSYDLLLQQQTLLLQFQLQLQHKYPQFILPASTQSSETQSDSSSNPQSSPAPSTSSESSNRIVSTRLEDMKVSDLKAELKRRSLPVSGSKPLLIERLKLFGTNQLSNGEIMNDMSETQTQQSSSPNSPEENMSVKDETEMEICEPTSPHPKLEAQRNIEIQQKTRDDIVREQQKRIEELQRELTLSQLKLQAATRSETKAQVVALQKHLQAKQQQQATLQIQQLQALQARQSAQMNEEQQKLQQQQHVAFQNQKNLANGLVLNGLDATIVLNQILGGKVKLANNNNNNLSNNNNNNSSNSNNQRGGPMPNFFPIITATTTTTAPIGKSNVKNEIEPTSPPNYEEVAKSKMKKPNVKSQIVDDVLEILIKNGELPPSAAQDPITPNSAEPVKNIEPVYPSSDHQQTQIGTNTDTLGVGLDPNELLDSLENLDGVDLSQFVMELSNNQNSNGENSNVNISDSVPMDTDEWLESLLPCNNSSLISDNRNNNVNNENNSSNMNVQDLDLSGYDPLLGFTHDPFDPFNLDEFRAPSDLSWDKLDYAA